MTPDKGFNLRIGYFDCPTGVSGDMILGAIVDCGVELEQIREGLRSLPIQGYEIIENRVLKHGLSATQVEIIVQDQVKERNLSEIIAIVTDSNIPENIKERAIRLFTRIGAVEARIHGVSPETIHLHELGGIDTIIDVLGTFIGLETLGLDKIYASALPLATGMIDSAHGPIPLPAPATLALLQGIPIRGSELNRELVTPTGAGILTSITERFGEVPEMRLLQTGYGAGKIELPVPNVLRLLIGERSNGSHAEQNTHIEQLKCVETNIDNMNPELYTFLQEKLFESGALDVTITPIYMKKNRPGSLVSVLCPEESADKVRNLLFLETTTLGVREYSVVRYFVERQIINVSTEYGDIRIKFSKKGESYWNYSPEYEDCQKIATEQHIPIMKIYRAAERAAEGYLRNSNNLK